PPVDAGRGGGAMDAVEAPAARAPSAPSAGAAAGGLRGGLALEDCAEELQALRAASAELQERCLEGRQAATRACALLQRGDFGGARAALAAARAAVQPEALAFWGDARRRQEACQAAGLGGFLQACAAGSCFLAFLERGAITPSPSACWGSGLADVDDEAYLLGVVDAAREVERYAVNRGRALDLASVQLCAGVVRSLEQAMMQFDLRNGDLRRKFDGIKYVAKKLEIVAYEVDLAGRRASAVAPPPAESAAAAEPPAKRARQDLPPGTQEQGAVDLGLLSAIKRRYDQYDTVREQVIKRSRDVLKSAKNAVFALQRDDFKKADALIQQCSGYATAIFADAVQGAPSLRGGGFAAALEELVEALLYRAYRKDRRLLSRKEVQEDSGLSFELSVAEYLGGLTDLTGEVVRLAVRSAGRGREAVGDVELGLACVDAVYAGIQSLPFLPGSLGKKVWPLKASLQKIEGVLYELALLSEGGISVRAPASSVEQGSGDACLDEPGAA
ncbi:unnamed protein product, partial [Prorocentrum cordatum]